METLSASGICKLVVVFDVIDKLRRPQPPRRTATPFRLPLITLPLKQVTVLDCRNKLLRLAEIVGEIRFVMPGKCHYRTVMEIVVPKSVQAVAPAGNRPHELRFLRFVFGHDDDLTVAGRGSHRLGK